MLKKKQTKLKIGKKKKRCIFKKKFNLKIDKNLKTNTKVDLKIEKRNKNELNFFPMFDHSDILFLSKPVNKEEKENKRKLASVDISNERKERIINSKTQDVGKKIHKRQIRKKLKLNIRKSIRIIEEIPTFDREIKEIKLEAQK